MRKIFKHGSTVALVAIVIILIVPSWRITFQGWFQGLFMSDVYFESSREEMLPASVSDWILTDMDNQNYTFSKYTDRPVVLSFWATWCPPCRAELKELKSLSDDFESKIHFISVSEEAVSVIKNTGLHEDYSFLYATGSFPGFFNVTAYPTLCIINKNGKMVYQHSGTGDLDNEKNRSFLRSLIENK